MRHQRHWPGDFTFAAQTTAGVTSSSKGTVTTWRQRKLLMGVGRSQSRGQVVSRASIRFLITMMLVCLFQAPTIRLASAQADPRQILAAVILQLQTGTPNPNWYGAQLWQTIAMQTNNSGVYVPLVQLGQVTNVVLSGQTQLPAGPVYSMVAQHQNGVSTWLLGISLYSNRIEYANFNVGNATPLALPAQPVPLPWSAAPQPGTTPNPPPSPPPAASSTSEACKKFPNLC
jgi:hypothetical protein